MQVGREVVFPVADGWVTRKNLPLGGEQQLETAANTLKNKKRRKWNKNQLETNYHEYPPTWAWIVFGLEEWHLTCLFLVGSNPAQSWLRA